MKFKCLNTYCRFCKRKDYKHMLVFYHSFLHLVFGFRRAPLTPQRAREILSQHKLQYELTDPKPKRPLGARK